MSLADRGRSQSFSSITEAFPLLRSEPEADKDASKERIDKLWALMSTHLSSDVPSIQRDIAKHVEYTLASSRFNFDTFKAYVATSHTIRDRLLESWNDTNAHFDALGVKRVSYLSLEFLMGRSMQNALLNMDLDANYVKALREIGFGMEDLLDQEKDAALGNGGLGRLAACFLDSMATLDLPAWGYGIRYNYGIFKQLIKDGAQVEVPDYWLTHGNPWEIMRQDVVVPVRFYGATRTEPAPGGGERVVWSGGEVVMAMAYDTPIPGFDTYNTINLRLWKALPAREFDFASFNSGDYMAAVEARQRAEAISAVLYPSDSTLGGKELRLKQQYFFVTATLHDIIRRFKRAPGWAWPAFSEKNAVQLNDTHPSIAIAELMRILVDLEGVPWGEAWAVTQRTFGYTNHTILPEALERWSVDLMGHLLPRNLEVIYAINWAFLEGLRTAGMPRTGAAPSDALLARVSIIEEGPHGKYVRMANLAVLGSHSVNGVAAIHTDLVKSLVFPEFFALFPERFNNKTNGVTPRRWINQANPLLADILTAWLDTAEWVKNLDLLAGLRAFAEDDALHAEWAAMKTHAKGRLADHIRGALGVAVSTAALFDVQVKRIHEYKRQQLNALYCIHRYRWIKGLSPAEKAHVTPRVTIFGGKAAPGYDMAKRIIRLIHRIADKVNNDPDVGDLFKVVFIPNYNVSLAEVIIPASDISQHISTAGMEASGTSNMKFAMNGGSIIGTMDGANIEIAQEVDRENLFIFGAEAHEVPALRAERRAGGPPREYCAELKAVLADLEAGRFGPLDDVGPLLATLRWENDYYLVSHDFPDYCRAQSAVDAAYLDRREWTRRSIACCAGMGKFSTDRTIAEYASEIWGLKPARRASPVTNNLGNSRSFPSLEGLAANSGAGARK